MKRLFIVLLTLVALSCAAQEYVYYESTPTLEWDAVTSDDNGDAFLPGDVVEYEVYLFDAALGDITTQTVDALTYLATVSGTSTQLSFTYRSEWAVAVRTRHTDGGGNVALSGFAYSVVAEDTALGVPFVYAPVLQWVPLRPAALRDSGM